MNDDQGGYEDVMTGAQGASRYQAAGESPSERGRSDGDGSGKSERRRWSAVTEMVVLLAVALTIALLVKTFVVQPFFIPSGSMKNTLLVGDKVLVNKLVYHVRPIERGDIVVFNGTGSWNLPVPGAKASSNPVVRGYDDTLGALFHSIAGLFGEVPNQIDYIKRVIGVPGDHVVCCNSRGQITVNGVALSEKSYLHPHVRPSAGRFNIVVPPGRLWVMGDNRARSADSRFHDCAYSNPDVECLKIDRNGTIPETKVIGRAFMIVWPIRQFRVLPIPPTFGQPGLAGTSHAAALPGPGSARVALGPAAPCLPLGVGLGVALPLTLMRRKLRRRRHGR